MLRSEFWLHGLLLKSNEDALFDIELTIGSKNAAEEKAVFINVRNVRIAIPNGSPCLLYGVYLDDVRSSGWEGIRYMVRQAEQNCIEWSCYEALIQKL